MHGETFSFASLLARAWWLVLLRGLAAILFGVLAFLWPGLTLLTLVILFAVYAVFDGVLALSAAFQGGGLASGWWLVLVALANLAAGVIALLWPHVTALVLILLIAASAVARGLLEIVGAIRLRKVIDNERMLILSGAVSVVFGLAVMIAPRAGALALAWLVAIWAVVFGLLTVGLALRLRRIRRAR